MYFVNILTLFFAFAVLDIAAAIPQGQNGNNGQNNSNGQNNNNNGQNNNANDCNTANTGNSGNNGNNNAADVTTLDSANIQQASDSNGNPSNGQAASLTDPANFINFCSGKTITNGQQNTGGSCNGIVMGDMPSKENMISSIIVNPAPGANIDADTTFQVQFQTANLVAGTFTNPDNTYYAAPQQLQGGKVVGHSHVTIQDLGNSLTPDSPPDPTTFAFFLGIDNSGNGNGLLTATVNGGLPAGNYRVCTLTSSSNHQPVLMPVAQRGAQDDCTKFTVGGNGNSNNNNNNNNNGKNAGTQQQGNNNNAGAQQQGNGNQKQSSNNQNGATSTQSSASSSQTSTANSQNGNANQNGNAAADCNTSQQGSNPQDNNNQANSNNQNNGAAQGEDCNQNQNQNQKERQGGGMNRAGRNRQRFAAREFIS